MSDYAKPATRIKELQARIAVSPEGCWEWQGKVNRKRGYGYVYHAGLEYVAHRVFYTALVGSVPVGLDLDHLCRNRRCVNPDHLEPVTRSVNLLRGSQSTDKKTHCVHGHSLADAYVDKRGGRSCRTCTMQRAADTRARKRVG